MNRKPVFLVVGAAAAIAVALPLSLVLPPGRSAATPGAGVSSTLIARGTTDEHIKINAREPTDVVLKRVTLQPGGSTGWHTHSGAVLVVVESGILTLHDEHCDSQTYTAGQAVQMPVGHHHGHVVTNEAGAPLVAAITVIVPAGTPLLTDHPAPHCATHP